MNNRRMKKLIIKRCLAVMLAFTFVATGFPSYANAFETEGDGSSEIIPVENTIDSEQYDSNEPVGEESSIEVIRDDISGEDVEEITEEVESDEVEPEEEETGYADIEDVSVDGFELEDGVSVSVEPLSEEAFEEGTVVTVEAVEVDETIEESIADAIIDDIGEGAEVLKIYGVDISFINNGEEVQPDGDVHIQFDGLDVPEGCSIVIYHDDHESEGLDLIESVEDAEDETSIGADVDSFSEYYTAIVENNALQDDGYVLVSDAEDLKNALGHGYSARLDNDVIITPDFGWVDVSKTGYDENDEGASFTVTLDLNDHKIFTKNLTNSTFAVYEDRYFTVKNGTIQGTYDQNGSNPSREFFECKKGSHLYLEDLTIDGVYYPVEAEEQADVHITNCTFQNNYNNGDGGAIQLKNGSTFTAAGENFFLNNKAKSGKRGGAIYFGNMAGDETIIDNITFEGNSSESSGWGSGGGAICVEKGKHFIVGENTKFINNHANASGGAILFTCGEKLTVNGTYTGNTAYLHEGGAVAVFGNSSTDMSEAELGKCTFEYNKTGFDQNENANDSYYDWGGGAIFIADSASLFVPAASAIYGNTAGGFGGGVAGCSTGRVFIFGDGSQNAILYNNEAIGQHISGSQSAKSDDHKYAAENDTFINNGSDDFFCALSSVVSRSVFGNAALSGSVDQKAISGNETLFEASYVSGLTADLSNPPDPEGRGIDVIIRNNTSYTHGGGILCNGYIVVGSPNEDKLSVGKSMELKAFKSLQDIDGRDIGLSGHSYDFVITNTPSDKYTDDDIVTTGKSKENGDIVFDGKLSFDQSNYPESGVYTYYLHEKPFNDLVDGVPVKRDSSVYRIDINVSINTTEQKVGGYNFHTDKYVVDKATVTLVDEDGNEIENAESIRTTLDTRDESHAAVLTINGAEGNKTFVNRVDPEPEPERVNLTINKDWIGSAPDGLDSVSVIVTGVDTAGNEVYTSGALEIYRDQNWTLRREDLDKFTESGDEIRYFVSEIVPEDAGYYQVNENGTEYTGDEQGTQASGQSDDSNELTVKIFNRSISRQDDLAEPDYLKISATKALKGEDGSNIIAGHTYSFEITGTKDQSVGTATNDEKGDIVFETPLTFDNSNYTADGKHTYYLKEMDVTDSVGRAPVIKDKSEYRIDVSVKRSDIRKKGDDGVYYDTYKYEIESVNVIHEIDSLGSDESTIPVTFNYSHEKHILNIFGRKEDTATFVNTLGPKPQEYVDLLITKEWKGKAPVESIKVIIHGRNKAGDNVIKPIYQTVESNGGLWSLMIKKSDKLLPKYTESDEEIIYSVEESIDANAEYIQVDEDGKEIEGETVARPVSEVIAENANNTQDAVGESGENADDEVSYYVVNLYNRPVKNITVEKSWENDWGYHAGNAGDDKNDYVVVTLYSGNSIDAAIANGTVYFEGVRIRASDNWKHTFKKLPVYNLKGDPITYKVIEEVISGSQYYKDPVYDSSNDGIIKVINELDDTSLTVRKIWVDDDESVRPDHIDVEILAGESFGVSQATAFEPLLEFFGLSDRDDGVVGTVTLNAANDWKQELTGLRRYVLSKDEEGNTVLIGINYSAREQSIPKDYSVREVTQNNGEVNIVTITNTYKKPTPTPTPTVTPTTTPTPTVTPTTTPTPTVTPTTTPAPTTTPTPTPTTPETITTERTVETINERVIERYYDRPVEEYVYEPTDDVRVQTGRVLGERIRNGGVVNGVLGVRAEPSSGVLGARVGPVTDDEAITIFYIALMAVLANLAVIVAVIATGRRKKSKI